jgi:hypothetical protein
MFNTTVSVLEYLCERKRNQSLLFITTNLSLHWSKYTSSKGPPESRTYWQHDGNILKSIPIIGNENLSKTLLFTLKCPESVKIAHRRGRNHCISWTFTFPHFNTCLIQEYEVSEYLVKIHRFPRYIFPKWLTEKEGIVQYRRFWLSHPLVYA